MLVSIQNNYEDLKLKCESIEGLKDVLLSISEEAMRKLIKILEPFQESRLRLCEERSPTLCLVALVRALLLQATCENPTDDKASKEMKTVNTREKVF